MAKTIQRIKWLFKSLTKNLNMKNDIEDWINDITRMKEEWEKSECKTMVKARNANTRYSQ